MQPSKMESQITRSVERIWVDERQLQADQLAVEEPLEIRIEFGPTEERLTRSLSITMRTPGADFDLAAGFLLTEGIIHSPLDIEDIKYCGPALFQDGSTNVVKLSLHRRCKIDMKKLERHFYTTSSCGVCGKTSIEALKVESPYQTLPDPIQVSAELLARLPSMLDAQQDLFHSTGGLHATALFSSDGKLLCVREDVGRHNAFDKVIGYSLRNDELPLTGKLVLVSGRASFELIQKASVAGLRLFVAIGAPSSLAVQLADEMGMTLVGFLKANKMNIYSGAHRITGNLKPQERPL